MQTLNDPRGDNSFYQDPSRQYLLELIGHLSEHSEAIIFLEGPLGSGRSSLLQRINEQIIAQTDDPVKHHLNTVDDADQLPAYELTRIISQFPHGRLLLAGLPGSCETIRNLGYLDQNRVERLTIPPFTRRDAEYFLTAYCPPTTAYVKQKILDSCRLFPGDLRQAVYDRELTRGAFRHHRLRRLSGWALIPLAVTLLWLGYAVLPEKFAHGTKADTPPLDSAPVIRETEAGTAQPSGTLLEDPASEIVDSVTQPVFKPPTVASVAPPISDLPAEPRALFSNDRQQILAVDPDHFTLQLMLASEIENTNNVIDQLGITQPHYRYKKAVDDQWLYCLLYGNFASYELAGDALSDLPTEIKRLGPWRRRFADIQSELRATSSNYQPP